MTTGSYEIANTRLEDQITTQWSFWGSACAVVIYSSLSLAPLNNAVRQLWTHPLAHGSRSTFKRKPCSYVRGEARNLSHRHRVRAPSRRTSLGTSYIAFADRFHRFP